MSVRVDWWIRWTTTGCVGLLALIAGTVSYLHMHLLVELHGQPGWVAALTPLSVDGMIVAASTTLLADSRAGERGGVLPWALLVVGSAASPAANVAVAQPAVAGRVIAAWPSFALIGAYELLMRQVRRNAAGGGKPHQRKPVTQILRQQAGGEAAPPAGCGRWSAWGPTTPPTGTRGSFEPGQPAAGLVRVGDPAHEDRSPSTLRGVVGCCEVGGGVWQAGPVPFEDDLQSGRGGLAGDDWWRSAVIYQIYPRSFADSGGDGVGDLPGITGRLDYLVELGVDAVWLSPFYASPMVDFGYDITDHCVVDPVFGTLADFDGLLAAAHARGLRVLVDFVPNHTSNRHPWFAESRSSRVSRRRDWYVWANPAPGGGPPNNWLSAFPAAGSAWTLDGPTGQYYLHSYTTAQPDLNWHNAEVRAAMAGVLRFFLDRGVDGFRIDAAHRLIKDPTLADNPADVAGARSALAPGGRRLRHIDQPGVHTVLRELRAVLAGYGGDRLLLGEVGVADPARWAAYYGRDDELTLPLNFGFWSQPFTAAGFRTAVDTTEGVLPPGAWPIYALGNHDLPRLASRYDDGRHGQARARLAAMLLLTLRGTPLLYYGDEIGMTDVSIPPASTVDSNGRDPARTPMQWDATGGAGFTTGRPWLPISASAPTVNVAVERDEPGSLLNLYRDLIGLRRGHPVLRDGDYQALAPTQPALYAYLRRTGGQQILVTLNFDDQPHDLDHPEVGTGRILLSTRDHPQPGSLHPLRLAPYEGVIAHLT